MKKETTDSVLADLDNTLADFPTVTCWRCEKRAGEPSLCVECHHEVGGVYVAPPKGTKRVTWTGG